MTAYVMFGKKPQNNDRIVNIDKEKYEINSLHVYSCYDFICKEIFVVGFRKINTNLLYTFTILIICKEEKKLNINIASIFFTLTEINNETHYVAKKIKNSVNLQGSRSSDYTITAMVQ